MIDIIRIKRRSADGEPGPPESLAASEIAYNEADDMLYYGKGDDGTGRAMKIVTIGGMATLIELAALRADVVRLSEMVKSMKDQLGL